MKTSAVKLKELREARGMSQADCARAIGLDRTTYVKYENGGSIRRNVEKLARFFNVSTDYLLGRTDDPTPPQTESKIGDTDPVSDIFDDVDIRSLARRNLEGKTPEQVQKLKKKTLKLLKFLYEEEDD